MRGNQNLSGNHRAIAVDLIGIGDSAKPEDAQGSMLYTANRLGEVEAHRLPDLQGVNPSLESLWKIERDARGTPTLIPLPGGGWRW